MVRKVEHFFEIGSLTPMNPFEMNFDPRFEALGDMRWGLRRDPDSVSLVTFKRATKKIVFRSPIQTIEELAKADSSTIAKIKQSCTPTVRSAIDVLRERAISLNQKETTH